MVIVLSFLLKSIQLYNEYVLFVVCWLMYKLPLHFPVHLAEKILLRMVSISMDDDLIPEHEDF